MRKEKKISLMNCVWRLNIKSWSRNTLWGMQIYLPYCLPNQPRLCNVLRNSGFFNQLLHSWQSLPKAFRAIINSWKFSSPFYCSSKEMSSSQSQSQSHSFSLDHFASLLFNIWLVEVRKLRFSQIKLLIMHLVVQLQSITCVHHILFCLLLDSVISCDPIKKLC